MGFIYEEVEKIFPNACSNQPIEKNIIDEDEERETIGKYYNKLYEPPEEVDKMLSY